MIPTSPSFRPLLALFVMIGAVFGWSACAPAAAFTPTPPATATITPTPTLENWELKWSDEFDGPDGSAIDTSKWSFQTGGSGWGNAELEYYTDRVENAYIENPTGTNGVLVIKAIKEKYMGAN